MQMQKTANVSKSLPAGATAWPAKKVQNNMYVA
jgi:hypothetical protein